MNRTPIEWVSTAFEQAQKAITRRNHAPQTADASLKAAIDRIDELPLNTELLLEDLPTLEQSLTWVPGMDEAIIPDCGDRK